jgi:hypothetical protein
LSELISDKIYYQKLDSVKGAEPPIDAEKLNGVTDRASSIIPLNKRIKVF